MQYICIRRFVDDKVKYKGDTQHDWMIINGGRTADSHEET